MPYDILMQSYRNRIETFLPGCLPAPDSTPERLREAMAYSLLAGGKRVRPVLALAVADLLREGASQSKAVLRYAAAVEMIHTYSLIHDDLPAMDDDVLRRGKPTNHVVFGEALAILAGDALLTRAFELAAKADEDSAENISDASNRLEAWLLLANLAGSAGMIGGQVLDLAAEGRQVSVEHLRKLQALKTGALLQAPVLGVAALLDAPPAASEALRAYSLQLGLAFQIRDDILDTEATSAELGKTPGKDEVNQKATYVTLLGKIEAAQALAAASLAALQACEQLTALGYDSRFLAYFAEVLSGRTS